jgi:phosphatidylglycerophosphatase A
MKTLAKILATGFGSGYSPLAPGTAGALLAAIGIGLWSDHGSISFYPEWTQLAILSGIALLLLIIGVWSCNMLEKDWGKDPQRIVIDEMLGLTISLIAVPLNWKTIAVGFILFRLFDIWKPLGIKKLESIKGGWGIMLDDLLAGVYANIVLHLLLLTQILS